MTDQSRTPDAATRAVLVTALLVAAFAFARILIGSLVSAISTLAFGGAGSYGAVGVIGSGIGWQFLTELLPLAAGVFVGFRIIKPITAELSLSRVLVRSLVATGIVAVLVFIVGLFMILATSVTNNIFGNSFPLGQVGGAFAQALTNVASTLSTFLSYAPLVALAAVLLWLWLRRRA